MDRVGFEPTTSASQYIYLVLSGINEKKLVQIPLTPLY